MSEITAAKLEHDFQNLRTWASVLEIALYASQDEITFAGRDALATLAGDIARLIVRVEKGGKNIDPHNVFLDSAKRLN